MKKLIYTGVVITFLITNALSYKMGFNQAKRITTTTAIAERFVQVFGSPNTQELQCEFDFIIYNDVTECQP